MGAFLSVAKGSSEEPWLLELHYNRPNAGREEKEMEGSRGESGEGRPTVLVGKGANIYTCIYPKISQEKLSLSCSDLHVYPGI